MPSLEYFTFVKCNWKALKWGYFLQLFLQVVCCRSYHFSHCISWREILWNISHFLDTFFNHFYHAFLRKGAALVQCISHSLSTSKLVSISTHHSGGQTMAHKKKLPGFGHPQEKMDNRVNTLGRNRNKAISYRVHVDGDISLLFLVNCGLGNRALMIWSCAVMLFHNSYLYHSLRKELSWKGLECFTGKAVL